MARDKRDSTDSPAGGGVIGRGRQGGVFAGGANTGGGQSGGSGTAGGCEADRAQILVMLRKLEDHGRVSGGEENTRICIPVLKLRANGASIKIGSRQE